MALTYETRPLGPHSAPGFISGSCPPIPGPLSWHSKCACMFAFVWAGCVCRTWMEAKVNIEYCYCSLHCMLRQILPLKSEPANLLVWLVSFLERSPSLLPDMGITAGLPLLPAIYMSVGGLNLGSYALATASCLQPMSRYIRGGILFQCDFFPLRTAWNLISKAQAKCNLSLVWLQGLAQYILLPTI